jgi:anti-sigma regulatory factor (Ser/Thr protein kinase)
MQANISISVPHSWQYVRTVRHKVDQVLKDFDADARSATVMAAAELVENAIKYGESVPSAETISFGLTVDGDCTRIEVVNGSTDARGVEELQKRIEEVSGAHDGAALYMSRLEELMADPSESGKLGIYRIALEGQFTLRCHYANLVVAVTASRTR